MIRVTSNWQDPSRRMVEYLRKFPSNAKAAAANGQYAAAQEVMQLAQQYAPIGPGWNARQLRPSGALKAGAYVRRPTAGWGAGRATQVEMGFEGLPYQYMVYQHENAGLKHPQGGKAFFFRDAADERRAESKRIIAHYVNHFLRTGKILPLVSATIPTSAAG
jgi:hypothetical protein